MAPEKLASCCQIVIVIVKVIANKYDTKKGSVIKLNHVKSVRIWSYSGPHLPEFGLNTERYEVSLFIQPKGEKMQPRITPNKDIFHALLVANLGNKDKSCLHYRNLQLYLYLGMK